MKSVLVFTIESIIMFLGAQKLVLEESQQLTPCTENLRSETDLYVVTVRLGDSLTHLMSKGWQPFFTIQMSTNTPLNFQDICQILVNATDCGSHLQSKCHCHQRNISTRGATLFVTGPALAIYSHGVVRGVWKHTNGTSVYSDGLTLPAILDETAAVLKLSVTVNNVSESTKVTDQCYIQLKSDVYNTLTLCCYNTALPCYPYIQLGGFIVSNNNSPCSSYIFTPDPRFTSTAVISYSVCSQRESIEIGNCTLEAERNFHKFLKFIPRSLLLLGAILFFGWLIVVILYLVVKICRPRKEQRRDGTQRSAMHNVKADVTMKSDQELTTMASDPTQDKRISNNTVVGDQVTAMIKENVEHTSEVKSIITSITATAPSGNRARFDLRASP